MSHLHSKTSEVNFVFSRKLSNSFLVYSKQLIEKRDINFFYMQSELIYNNSYLFPDRNFNVSDLSIPNSFKLSYATIIPFCWQSWLWHLYRFKDIEKRDFYNFQILLSYKPIGYKDILNILSTLHTDEVMLSWTLFDNLRTGGSLSDWALWGITIYLIAQKSNLKNKLTEFEKYILKLYKDDFISHVNEIIENYHKWNETFGNSEKISDSLHEEGQNFKLKVYEYFNNNNMFNSLKLLKKENILEFREILDSL